MRDRDVIDAIKEELECYGELYNVNAVKDTTGTEVA